MITQEDCNKIVDILRNVGNKVIGDSLSRGILFIEFASLFMKQFNVILPDGVTLPEDAEQLIRVDETLEEMLTQI